MSPNGNPYPPGSPEYAAFEQMQSAVTRTTQGGQASASLAMPAAAAVQRGAAAASTYLPQLRGAAPSPMPQRSYDAKGHASDNSQSVGLDNPWKIGAFAGGTYDHATLAQLAAIADGQTQGSITAGEAAYILRTVGFVPDGQPDFEQRWAAGRKLDRYAQTAEAGGTSPWWHDPANAPDEQTRQEYGGAYGSEAEARDNYGWWDTEGGRPTRRQAPTQPAPTMTAPTEQYQSSGPNNMPPIYPQEIKPDGSAGHSTTPLALPMPQPTPAPALDVAPLTQNMRDWWTSRR